MDYLQQKRLDQVKEALDKFNKEFETWPREKQVEYWKSLWPPNSFTEEDFPEMKINIKENNSNVIPADGGVKETYPDNNPKTKFGITKPAMSNIPNPALIHLMDAFTDGARKYGPLNWREKKVSSSIYYDAAMRHLMAWYDGEDLAPDSGVHHLGHAMACMAIILDGFETGNIVDNRPPKGNFGELIIKHTKKNDS